LDHTDAKILDILQRDGRISMQKLAAQINMSAPSAIERVKKLEESGAIMGYKAVVNPEKVGREISAVVLLAIPPENHRRFLEYARNNPNVVELQELAGRYGYYMRTCCKDADAFMDMTRKLPEFGLSESYVIVSKDAQAAPIQPILP